MASLHRRPLEGIRILDFTVVWAGPYATMQLADWGAEVIRVESVRHFANSTRGQTPRPPKAFAAATARNGFGFPNGDPGARPWNRTPIFNANSRNKLSMTLDLTQPEGVEVLHRLVAMSDGLIENNLPPHAEKLGLDWDTLSAINPNLILVRMPAFGLTGPYRDYRTWGNHMEALAGHTLIRTYPDVSPEYAASGVPSDAAGGISAALGFVLALRQRRKTGKGLLIESATAENFVSFLGEFVLDYSLNGRTWEQMGNEHMHWAPHNVYRCAGDERWVTIAVRNDEEWRALCEAMDRADLASDPRFANASPRHAHRRDLDPLIEEWTSQVDPYWVMYRLQERGIPAGVVMTDAELLESRHHQARGFFEEVDHPESGRFRHTGRLWRASKTEQLPARHAPLLGEHNEYVYKGLLGFSDDEYRRFEEAGHIGMDYPP